MKKIEENFNRSGFTYSLNKRVGEVAMFTKTQTNKADSPAWIEVVTLIEDEGQEVFPANTSWGIRGFTFKGDEVAKAEVKYQELCEEFGEDASDDDATDLAPTDVLDEQANDDEIEVVKTVINDSTPEPTPKPKANKPKKDLNAAPKTRGRKRADVNFQVPTTGTFRVRDLADKYDVSPPFVHNRLNELIEQGKVKVVERVQGKRGKPQKIMEWIN